MHHFDGFGDEVRRTLALTMHSIGPVQPDDATMIIGRLTGKSPDRSAKDV
jgi:hypothetical protein